MTNSDPNRDPELLHGNPQALLANSCVMLSHTCLLLIALRVVPTLAQKMSDAVRQDLMTPIRHLGEGCGYKGCPTLKEGMLNVHIVPHTHGELGFVKTFHSHYTGKDDYYDPSNVNWKRILDATITELWNRDNRKFTLSDMPYFFHWWSSRDGTVHRMVYNLVRQGRLHFVGGGWGMPDESCTSYHALLDSFTLALRKLNKTFGPCGRPLVAWQADVFGHSREFTNMAAMLAFDGLFVNPISFEDELDRMRTKELEMLWRGSDDIGPESDVFTHKLFDGYWPPPGFCFGSMCTDPLLITSDSQLSNVEERVNAFIDAAKNRQGPHYATSHVMVVMGKRMGYYDAMIWFNNIDVLIAKVNEKSYKSGDNVHLMYSAPACYLRAVFDSSPALPIKQDDFMPVTIDKKTHLTGLFTSRPTIKHMAREGHVFLQMAKQMYVLAGLPAKEIKLYDELSWVMGVFQDHNIITGSMRAHVKDYYTHKMYQAVQKSTLVLKKAFNILRKSPTSTTYYRCAFNASSCRNTNTVRSFVVIYNPLAWSVTVPVRVPVVRHERHIVYNPKLQTVKAVSMKISDPVLNIPHRDTNADHEIVFMAENLPPMGYRSYYIESVTIAEQKKKKRRSLFKNLRKTKKKKYLSRQTDLMKIDDESMLDNLDYEYYDEDEHEDSTSLPDNETEAVNSRPLYYVPNIPQGIDPEVDVDEEKKHMGLFRKVKPSTSTEEAKEDEEFPSSTDKTSTRKEDYSTKPTEQTPKRITEEEDNKAEEEENTTASPTTENINNEFPKLINEKDFSRKSFKIMPTRIPEYEDKFDITDNNTQEVTWAPYSKHPKPITKVDLKKLLHEHPHLNKKVIDYIKQDQKYTDPKAINEEQSQNQTKAETDKTKEESVTRTGKAPEPPGFKSDATSFPSRFVYRIPNVEEDSDKKEDAIAGTVMEFDRNASDVGATTVVPSNITEHEGTAHVFNQPVYDDGFFPPDHTESYYPTQRAQTETKPSKKKFQAKPQKKFKLKPESEGNYRRLFQKPLKSVLVTRTTTRTPRTATEYDPMNDPDFDEDRNYFYRVSCDKFIKNKYVKVHLDDQNQVTGVTLSNGVEVALTISMYYYASDDPVKMGRPEDKKPGPYVFKVMDAQPVIIKDSFRSVVHKTYLVEEVQYHLTNWAGFVLRVYVERPLIELDWVVGPVPTADEIGKDVFIRYSTDLATEGVFYTDSNGRQTMKRVRDRRPTYEPVLKDIPSNFYPVTSKIYIEDPKKNIRFSVFNDRSQGGSSLHDGQIDLMVHRRILTEDEGIQAFLNETEYNNKGIVVRGKHYIYISKADHKPNKIYEKKLAKEIELSPQVFASPFNAYGDNSKEIWYGHNNEFRGVAKKLPAGVHVLTLQEWNAGALLLRLENYLEKADSVKSGTKTVVIKDLFANLKLINLRETTLGGNIWIEEKNTRQWNARDKFVKNFNEFYKGSGAIEYSTEDLRESELANITQGITLTPQQIRTFVITYQFLG